MLKQFPIALQQFQHLTRICEACPQLEKIEGCKWCKCALQSSKERYWAAVEDAECPEKRFDIFKDLS